MSQYASFVVYREKEIEEWIPCFAGIMSMDKI